MNAKFFEYFSLKASIFKKILLSPETRITTTMFWAAKTMLRSLCLWMNPL